jgi:hypothetical protein
MANNDDMLHIGRKGQLAGDVTFLMLKGAGLAALALFLIWLVISVIALIGRALPEESRMAPDPAPQAFIDMTAPAPAEEGQ